MRYRILWGALAASLIATGASAQNMSGPLSGTASSGSTARIAPTGGTATSALNDFGARVLSVTDFGAKCDGSTDDSAAISAAFQAIVTSTAFNVAGSGANASLRGLPGKHCRITSSVNFTGAQGGALRIVDLDIDCRVAGGVCIDALGSRFLYWVNTHVEGAGGTPPTIGIQIGRVNSSTMLFCDNQKWDQVTVHGTFSFAAVYDFACEVTNWDHAKFSNSNSSTSSNGLVLDGSNHWNATSGFVTVTLATDTQQSFTNNAFINLNVQDFGNGVPVWIEAIAHFGFWNSYVETTSASNPMCFEIYTASAGATQDVLFDVHCEDNHATETFLLTGPNATPTFNNITYNDQFPETTAQVFAEDTGITAVTANNLKVDIVNSLTVPITLFHQPSLWTVSGWLNLPSAAYWSQPAAFSGIACLGSLCYDTAAPPVALPISRNGEFQIDQQREGASVTTSAGSVRIVDGYRTDVAGGIGTMTFQRKTTTPTPPAGFTYALRSTVAGATTPSSTQRYNIQTNIESTEFNGRGWGGSTAQQLEVDGWIETSVSGANSVAFFCRNASNNRSLVHLIPIAAANTWTYFNFVIPGDTAGGWNATTPGSLAIVCGVNLGAGSTFQTATVDAWQGSGNLYATSGSLDLLANAAATLDITGFRMWFGLTPIPYQHVPYLTELDRAEHFYAKTFLTGTAPATAASALGAVTGTVPFAFSAGLKVNVPFSYPKPMFENSGAAPTITFFNPVSANANCYDVTQAADMGAAAALNIGDRTVGIQCPLVSGDAAGDEFEVQLTIDSGF
jgi:hypothetical protein